MIHAVVVVLVFLILVSLVFWILQRFRQYIPEPILNIVYIILVVVFVVIACGWLLNYSGEFGSFSYRSR